MPPVLGERGNWQISWEATTETLRATTTEEIDVGRTSEDETGGAGIWLTQALGDFFVRNRRIWASSCLFFTVESPITVSCTADLAPHPPMIIRVATPEKEISSAICT